MKISEFISALTDFQTRYGDLPVLVYPGPHQNYTFPALDKGIIGVSLSALYVAEYERRLLNLKPEDEVIVIY